MKLLTLIVIFFTLGALLIISNNNLKMHEEENLEKFSELYLKWADTLCSNAKVITGKIIKLEWFSS